MAVSLLNLAIGLLVELVEIGAKAIILMGPAGGICLRTWAVLTGKPDDRLNWWTAIGAATGVGVMILAVLVDLVIEGG